MRGDVRTKHWRVQWQRDTPIEEVTLSVPMTEIEARKYFRRLMCGSDNLGGTISPSFRVWPVPEARDRCIVCGQLLKLHRRGMSQFSRCL